MSLIEKAVKRLEELRRSGVTSADDAFGREKSVSSVPTPEAFVRETEAQGDPDGDSGLHLASPRVDASALGARAAGNARDPAVAEVGNVSARGPLMRATVSRTLDIDLESLKARGYVTPDVRASALADEFRVIKRPIIKNASGRAGAKVKNGNLVMITSAMPTEGKTFTAVNLAMSVAMELDNTVLLVDGDVAHPALPQLLGIPESPGLLDLLTDDKLDVSDALIRTNIDKLTVLPAGTPHRRATELLASEQMTALLRDLASRYPDRMIIFDSPPLLPTTEARVLATHMGQIVVVVAAESTSQNTLNQALATIENCEHVMMMLNKSSRSEVSDYGHYPSAPRH